MNINPKNLKTTLDRSLFAALDKYRSKTDPNWNEDETHKKEDNNDKRNQTNKTNPT